VRWRGPAAVYPTDPCAPTTFRCLSTDASLPVRPCPTWKLYAATQDSPLLSLFATENYCMHFAKIDLRRFYWMLQTNVSPIIHINKRIFIRVSSIQKMPIYFPNLTARDQSQFRNESTIRNRQVPQPGLLVLTYEMSNTL
jgi:hypothetical protein